MEKAGKYYIKWQWSRILLRLSENTGYFVSSEQTRPFLSFDLRSQFPCLSVLTSQYKNVINDFFFNRDWKKKEGTLDRLTLIEHEWDNFLSQIGYVTNHIIALTLNEYRCSCVCPSTNLSIRTLNDCSVPRRKADSLHLGK